MKLQITISDFGVDISRSNTQVPPLGAIFPSKQDTILNVQSTLVGLSEKVDRALPPSFQVFAGSEIYGWVGTSWEDGNTGEPVADAALSGSVTFRNPASYDIGITW